MGEWVTWSWVDSKCCVEFWDWLDSVKWVALVVWVDFWDWLE
ncbi:hypothetical protein ACRE1S_08455 [Helicobacter himalayensis]